MNTMNIIFLNYTKDDFDEDSIGQMRTWKVEEEYMPSFIKANESFTMCGSRMTDYIDVSSLYEVADFESNKVDVLENEYADGFMAEKFSNISEEAEDKSEQDEGGHTLRDCVRHAGRHRLGAHHLDAHQGSRRDCHPLRCPRPSQQLRLAVGAAGALYHHHCGRCRSAGSGLPSPPYQYARGDEDPTAVRTGHPLDARRCPDAAVADAVHPLRGAVARPSLALAHLGHSRAAVGRRRLLQHTHLPGAIVKPGRAGRKA